MDCAGFERGLAEIASADTDEATRARMLGELGRHAKNCPDCRGAAALVEVLEQPSSERDPVADPGSEYWDGFEARVRERIDRERAVQRPTRSRRWIPLAAAAAVVSGMALVWVLQEPTTPPVVSRTSTGPTGVATERSESEPVLLPQPLEDRLTEHPTGDVLEELDALAGWAGDWETGAESVEGGIWGSAEPFPDLSDLDEEARQALLRWLEEQTS